MLLPQKCVRFAYKGSGSKVPALRYVSLRFPAGSLIVVVGANGSGKFTLVKLLTRTYDVDAGEILVDGLSIKEYLIWTCVGRKRY